ncbi:MAG: ABC transporter permease subunit [Deltaproteobacteria bacterium]|nr:ABC transporter permease subunit [Deltaproteobacteria bacterium]
MKNTWLVAAITFKEGIRNRALYGILLIALLLCSANMVISRMFSYDLGKVAVDMSLSMVSFAGLIVIFFLGINLLAKDLERYTIYMVLSRPISRWEYVMGKFCGLGALLFMTVAILGGLSVLSVMLSTAGQYAIYVPPHFSWATFALALTFILFSLLIVTAVAVFFCTLTTSSFMSMLLTLCVYYIGQNVELVRKLLFERTEFIPNLLLRQGISVVSWIFPNLSAFDLKTTAAYGLPVKASYLLWTAGYGLTYVGLLLAFSILIFQRRELT